MTPTPPDLGALQRMVALDIEREGEMSSFMIRAGLLSDILSHSTRQAERIVELEAALRPFARSNIDVSGTAAIGVDEADIIRALSALDSGEAS